MDGDVDRLVYLHPQALNPQPQALPTTPPGAAAWMGMRTGSCISSRGGRARVVNPGLDPDPGPPPTPPARSRSSFWTGTASPSSPPSSCVSCWTPCPQTWQQASRCGAVGLAAGVKVWGRRPGSTRQGAGPLRGEAWQQASRCVDTWDLFACLCLLPACRFLCLYLSNLRAQTWHCFQPSSTVDASIHHCPPRVLGCVEGRVFSHGQNPSPPKTPECPILVLGCHARGNRLGAACLSERLSPPPADRKRPVGAW